MLFYTKTTKNLSNSKKDLSSNTIGLNKNTNQLVMEEKANSKGKFYQKIHLLMQARKRWSILKETFVEFSQRTDFNAYGKIFKYNHSLIKILWLLVLIASLSLTALVMAENVRVFFEYNIVSQLGLIYEAPTEFPAITFCDNNPFTSDISPPIFDKYPIDYYNLIFLQQMAASAPYPFFDDEKRKKLGLQLWLIQNGYWAHCRFNNTDCSNDLHWYWSYDYGNCFQFNVGLNYTNDFIERKQSNVC